MQTACCPRFPVDGLRGRQWLWQQAEGRTDVPDPPLLLAFQQAPVGGDLDVQAQLGVHHLLVLLEQAGHVLLGLLQGLLQPRQLALGVVLGRLALLLRLGQGGLQFAALGEERRKAAKKSAGCGDSASLWGPRSPVALVIPSLPPFKMVNFQIN